MSGAHRPRVTARQISRFCLVTSPIVSLLALWCFVAGYWLAGAVCVALAVAKLVIVVRERRGRVDPPATGVGWPSVENGRGGRA